MQITEGHLCYHVASVNTYTAYRFSYPGRIAGEQLVVFRGTGKFYKAQLHNKMIHEFLNLLLCIASFCQIALCVDVNKGGGTS